MTPPLQLQTVHGRRAQLVNIALGAVAVCLLVGFSTDMTAAGRLVVGVTTLGVVAAYYALRLRSSGLFVEDGRIVSRRIFFDRSKSHGPALASLSLRPWYGVHQIMAKGDLPYGVPCMLRFGAVVPRWLAGAPNELLVRATPVRGERGRSRWTPTGIVWTDDDAFLSDLAAYVDAALGVDPATTPASAVRDFREASYPEFRTAHSLQSSSRMLILLAYACVLFGVGCMAFGVASGAVADGDLRMVTGGFVPAAFGVGLLALHRALPAAARSELGTATPEFAGLPSDRVLLSGVLIKEGRLVTDATFVTPAKLTISPQGQTSLVAAVSTRGKTHRLPALTNDPSLTAPNELLVRYPKAAQPSAARWHGTGIFWGSDGAAVLAHLEQALAASREQPGNERPLQDAA